MQYHGTRETTFQHCNIVAIPKVPPSAGEQQQTAQRFRADDRSSGYRCTLSSPEMSLRSFGVPAVAAFAAAAAAIAAGTCDAVPEHHRVRHLPGLDVPPSGHFSGYLSVPLAGIAGASASASTNIFYYYVRERSPKHEGGAVSPLHRACCGGCGFCCTIACGPRS